MDLFAFPWVGSGISRSACKRWQRPQQKRSFLLRQLSSVVVEFLRCCAVDPDIVFFHMNFVRGCVFALFQ